MKYYELANIIENQHPFPSYFREPSGRLLTQPAPPAARTLRFISKIHDRAQAGVLAGCESSKWSGKSTPRKAHSGNKNAGDIDQQKCWFYLWKIKTSLTTKREWFKKGINLDLQVDYNISHIQLKNTLRHAMWVNRIKPKPIKRWIQPWQISTRKVMTLPIYQQELPLEGLGWEMEIQTRNIRGLTTKNGTEDTRSGGPGRKGSRLPTETDVVDRTVCRNVTSKHISFLEHVKSNDNMYIYIYSLIKSPQGQPSNPQRLNTNVIKGSCETCTTSVKRAQLRRIRW